ncbi:MAG: hypothetical protein ACYDCH_05015, partial [Gaiellaceae bacterium]
MQTKLLPVTVLVLALAGLIGSGAWAVSRETAQHGGAGMQDGATSWMMGYRSGAAHPVRTIGEARTQAQAFADRLDLKVSEVIQFTNNYYARLDDKSGKPATEVLVDPSSGRVSLEYGPAMMWNTRYGLASGRFGGGLRAGGGMMGGAAGGMMGGSVGGMMGGSVGGMMGGSVGGMMSGGGMMGSAGGPSWTPPSGAVAGPLSARQAMAIADRRLAQSDPSLSVPDADAFPGYYTMEIERHGKIVGMLSVNATSGAVWNHWW